jgi:7-dehydrocholesterol reductase
MLFWGTLVFMPLVHNLQTLYLVLAPGLQLGWLAFIWVLFGIAMICINYDADVQRHTVRAKQGKCLVWGRPARCIPANFTDAQGKIHETFLLCCGYYKVARHFHYLPDIILLLLYCAPCGPPSTPLPYLYFWYLTALLLDRCDRIDRRCATKYGAAWTAYVTAVPYKLIPGFF